MLVLPNREVWTFSAYEDRVELEESVYLAGTRRPAPHAADRDLRPAPARCRGCTGRFARTPQRLRPAVPRRAGPNCR